MLDVTITIPGQAISANSLYKRGRGGQVFLAPEAVQYRKDAKKFVERAMKRSPPYEGGLLHAEVTVHQKYFNEDGTIKNVDLDNSLKNLFDSIFPVMGISDSTLFTMELRKIHTRSKPKCQIKIWESPLPALGSRSLKEAVESMRSFSQLTPVHPMTAYRSPSSIQMEAVSMFTAGPNGKTFNST